MDESSFTGETTPSAKHTHVDNKTEENEQNCCRDNIAYMGTFVCSGHGKVCKVTLVFILPDEMF